MDKLKFVLLSIVVLSLLGIAGYWAVVTIQSGNESAIIQKAEQLQKENTDLKKKVADLESEVGTLQAELDKLKPNNDQPAQTVYKYQDLINELQKLVDGKVLLKSGSKGTQVGIVQKFLNIYNNTGAKIDNDFGPSMVKAVTDFQKAEGLTADGQASTGTFSKMIDWLKKQG